MAASGMMDSCWPCRVPVPHVGREVEALPLEKRSEIPLTLVSGAIVGHRYHQNHSNRVISVSLMTQGHICFSDGVRDGKMMESSEKLI